MVNRRPRPGRGPRALRQWVDDLTAPREGVEPIRSGTLTKVVGIWAVGRAVNFLLIWLFFEISRLADLGFGPHGIHVRHFLTFLTGWDADHYLSIAEVGYPVRLPIEGGVVQENDWAFLPVLPFIERTVHDLTGVDAGVVGVFVSVAASLGATLALFLLLREVTTPSAAWWGMVLFTFAPLSFVFVLAYAESLFLFLTFTALLLTLRRKYLWVLPIGVLAAYTRPGILALALALGIVFVVRWLRRSADPFPWRERISLAATGLAIAVAGLSWTWIADLVTGEPQAYLRTEMAWWVPLVGEGAFVPLTPWFRFFGTYLGVFGILFVLAVMAAFAWWMFSRPVRRLGLVVVAFAASYGLYLFGVFLPQQSTFRLMMPLSPLLGDERFSATRNRRQWLLLGSLALQVVAVFLLWTIGYP
ncbi:hypothetical protein GCM10009808_03410 [Microbacterium sediminicola]|uniref:Mannosyltransferase (PIG-V) n=1 Tax=Microbacterium sediminicola TaxID=415210 RepID=A0ABP4TKU9_9MICO